MALTEQELTEQACRMREQGESYRSIGQYLESTGAEAETVAAVIKNLDKVEKENLVKPPTKKRVSNTSLVLGSIFMAGGAYLTYRLWGMGWVSTVSILMIGVGFMAFGGFFDRHNQRVSNK